MPLEFPATASVGFLLKSFAIALVLFHILLVWGFKVGKLGWKIVDYIWLSTTVLALIGSAGQVRVMVAEGRVAMSRQRADAMYNIFRSVLEAAATSPGYVCRQFVLSETSPPLERFNAIQREFDETCAWLQQLEAITPAKAPDMRFDIKVWPPPPQVSDASLIDTIRGLRRQYSYYDEAVVEFDKVSEMRRKSELEFSLILGGPFLLAIALALRLTKVTGEILLDRRSARTEPTAALRQLGTEGVTPSPRK